jgi:hypothetical protein
MVMIQRLETLVSNERFEVIEVGYNNNLKGP